MISNPRMQVPLTAEALLKTLLQFNTVRPGQEVNCITYLRDLLSEAGIPTTILTRDTEQPNVIARFPGSGLKPPLLMYGHIDVVPTPDQDWEHPPFDALTVDGCLWGRGALDMKGGIAMMLSALLRAKAEGMSPAGDVIL